MRCIDRHPLDRANVVDARKRVECPADRRNQSGTWAAFDSAVAISDAAHPMRCCQPLFDTVESVARATADDVFDDDRSGPDETVKSTSLRRRCIKPFQRQRITYGVRVDADLVRRLD